MRSTHEHDMAISWYGRESSFSRAWGFYFKGPRQAPCQKRHLCTDGLAFAVVVLSAAAMGAHVALAAGTPTPIVGIDLCFAAADSALPLVVACLCLLLHSMRGPHYPLGTRLCSGHGDGGRPHASPPGRQGCCGRSSQRCRRPAWFMTPCNAALLGSGTAHERPAARYVETTVCDPVARGSMYRAPIVVCDPEITDVDKRDTSTT